MPSPPVAAQLAPVGALEDLAREWQSLQERSTCSVFLSWHWIGPWLRLTAAQPDRQILRVTQGDELLGLAIVHAATVTRRRLIRSRQLYFNEWPVQGHNMVIEYNGLLARKGREAEVYRAAFEHLLELPGWDEICLGGFAETPALQEALQALQGRLNIVLDRRSEARRAEWSGQPVESADALAKLLLSANKRSQIRRTQRAYERELGYPVMLSAARDIQEALAWFEELGDLHTRYWGSRGRKGSFANPRWVRFHRDLISTSNSNGVPQVLKVTAGCRSIAYMYNLVWGRAMINIQSGVDYGLCPGLKPGYLAHWLAIEAAWRLKLDCYDLLAGDESYKRSLSNRTSNLIWLRLQQPVAALRLENILQRTWRWIRSNSRSSSPGVSGGTENGGYTQ